MLPLNLNLRNLKVGPRPIGCSQAGHALSFGKGSDRKPEVEEHAKVEQAGVLLDRPASRHRLGGTGIQAKQTKAHKLGGTPSS